MVFSNCCWLLLLISHRPIWPSQKEHPIEQEKIAPQWPAGYFFFFVDSSMRIICYQKYYFNFWILWRLISLLIIVHYSSLNVINTQQAVCGSAEHALTFDDMKWIMKFTRIWTTIMPLQWQRVLVESFKSKHCWESFIF